MYLFYVIEPVRLEAEAAEPGRRGLRYRPAMREGPASPGEAPGIDLCPPRDGTLTAESLYFGFSSPFLDDLAAHARMNGQRAPIRPLTAAAQARVLALPGLPPRIGYEAAGGKTVETQLDGA